MWKSLIDFPRLLFSSVLFCIHDSRGRKNSEEKRRETSQVPPMSSWKRRPGPLLQRAEHQQAGSGSRAPEDSWGGQPGLVGDTHPTGPWGCQCRGAPAIFRGSKIGWEGGGARAQGLAGEASQGVTVTVLLWASGSSSRNRSFCIVDLEGRN